MTLNNYFENVTHKPWITSGKDVQYKLVDKTLYFQCTTSKGDWKYNFMFGDVPYKKMNVKFRVHKGFLALWKSVRDEIALLDFDTIVGYSQGAALAGLAHEDYLFRKGVEPTSHVFGCPRFLHLPKKSIRGRFKNFNRHQNPLDIVTMAPPVLFGYIHVGEKDTLKKKAKMPKGYNFLQWISGHTPEEYRQRLI